MTKVFKFAAVPTLTLALLSAPTTAFAQKGWMSCMIVDDANKNAFYSASPVAADGTQITMAKIAYISFLVTKPDHLLNDAANARGQCNWAISQKDVLHYVKGFLAHFQGLGYSMHPDTLMPDPYVQYTK